MQYPSLSIVTINLNHLEGFERTRQSIRQQTFLDFEWIVVDGGSTDGSRELLEQCDAEIRQWVSEGDGGVYEAMNKGLALASGQYVLFLNSGDWFAAEDVLKKVSSFLREGDADVYYGNFLQLNSKDEWSEVHAPPFLTVSQFYGSGLCHQAEFIRRETLAHFSGYDTTYRVGADWVFMVKALLAGCATRHLPFPVVYYEGRGMSHNLAKLREEEKLRMFAECVPPAVDRDIRSLLDSRSTIRRLQETEAWVDQIRNRSFWVNLAMISKWSWKKIRTSKREKIT